jgi:hypothetical protein
MLCGTSFPLVEFIYWRMRFFVEATFHVCNCRVVRFFEKRS